MAYIEPLVMVFQEYATITAPNSTADLPPCIVGPCFHIIDPVEDEILALCGQYTKAGFVSHPFPKNAPGAIIDPESVKFRFKNLLVCLNEAPIIPDTCSVNTITLAADTFPDYIEIGDQIRFTASSNSAYYIVDIDPATYTIMLNRTVPGVGSFNIVRKVEEVILPYDAEGVLLDASSEKFTLTGAKYDGHIIEEAELYVGYKAMRQDLSSVGVCYSVDEITAQCGKISPENPLAYGLNVALANTTTAVYYVGVDSEDLAGYTAAKDRLENYSPMYSIVPLTQNPGILSMFKNHAEQMSQPEEGQWRIALGNSPLPKVDILAEGVDEKTGAGTGTISADGDGDLCVLTDPNAVFLGSSVDAGDTLVMIDEDDKEYTWLISGVVSDDILTVTQNTPFTAPFVNGGTYKYRIEHKMSKDEQAKAIGATSSAYGSRRFVHVWPDICIIDGQELPGYYLCCAVAGAIAGLLPHYGMTRLSISGIEGVKNAGDYFNRDQLNMIADGGTFIFVQASPTAPPHIRHQLTTDRSAVEFQELSFVKNYDYVSYICKDVLDEYIGRWNVTDETCAAIRTALTGTLETLRLQSTPKIGSPIISYTVNSIQRLETSRDRIEAYVDVEFPYPLNTIGLHIVSV